MKKAVVLLSGGLDSTTVLALARADGFDCYCLTVAYGQRHSVELEAARRVAVAYGAKEHKEASIDLSLWGGSALTANIDVPKDHIAEEMESSIPITYVPARNTVFLSVALAYAEAVGAHDIFVGVNAVDYSGYPDCRPAFVEAFEKLANLATKDGVEGRPFKIHAPLIDLKKAEIIAKGLELGVDYGMTHSCYDPDDAGRACGRCDSCTLREQAFAALGQTDPALAHLRNG
jgi:7-cyano-7-deazaguanine synthase